ncbi:hypothetical protein HHL16_16565 [Pseudoflavitalea sp. G-6-1-2]|uniref:hypothetical protein n=1 Tax=Pseudoflavitalea sp. G-6-1-2 TaxID=2728841 RepID=UPI001469FACF|nr:hypothetical protein [Pseudoflavitalea sp. G-6-1-2]NML22498.1 hypothetical protein [Pseudoflavitalea sp. G-6-1-2]
MKNQLYQVISVLTVVAYFLPIVIVAIRKLWKETPLMLFALYWAVGATVNLCDLLPGISENAMVNISVIYNMLDMPIVIAIICFTTKIRGIRNLTRVALPIYLLALCINPFIQGFNFDALKYLLGVGLILVHLIIIWDVVCQLRKLQHSNREKAMLLINAGLLFQYGTYVIIYIFDYFYTQVSNTTDNYILYYISSIVGVLVGSVAYLIIRRTEAGRIRSRNSDIDPMDEPRKKEADSFFSAY